MFFHISLQQNIRLHPRHFGPKLRQKLLEKLHEEVEGTCSGRYGYIIAVTHIESVGQGKIREGLGFVTFPIKFKAIVFRPFKNEVLDAVVTAVNDLGFFAETGPMTVFISVHQVPPELKYDQNSTPPQYVSTDGQQTLKAGDEVRLKILNMRIDATEIYAIGSIRDDYLGVIS